MFENRQDKRHWPVFPISLLTATLSQLLFRWDPILAQAAELTGSTLNQFLVQSALEKAEKVIELYKFAQ